MQAESWHLSKSVPITLVVAIVGQTIALAWYIANLDHNVAANTKEITRHEARIETLEATVQSQAVTLGRIDENLKAIRDMVEKMAARQK